jgi:hypothetical protein|tara:strand:+ start:178 stop:441 length:264 start_codon:yes stop_codon:yes gene_type:complete
MKIFVYKALFIGFMIFVVFYGTFGYVIKSYESKIQNSLNKDKLNFLKDKIRSELKEGLKKDRILNKEDSVLLNQFIKKITRELNDTN